jgi:hypothetical protein
MNNYISIILSNNIYTSLCFSVIHILVMYFYNKYNKIDETLNNYVKSFVISVIVIFSVLFLKSKNLNLSTKNINIEEPTF